jgi:signal transduction histidine kinase
MRPPKDAREPARQHESRRTPPPASGHEPPLALVDEQGRVLASSASFRDALGGSESDARPVGIEAYFDDTSSAALLRALRAPHSPGLVDVRTRAGGSTSAAVRVCSTRQGLRVGVITLRDERARRGSSRTDAPESALGELRHRLAGPVTAALGAAELLLTRPDLGLSDEARHGLDQIVANCTRMMEMLAASRADEMAATGEHDEGLWES